MVAMVSPAMVRVYVTLRIVPVFYPISSLSAILQFCEATSFRFKICYFYN